VLFRSPARVAGSAGTGKTVVALHRAVCLASADTSARVLLTTFSPTLARALAVKVKRLVGENSSVQERIDIRTLDQVCTDLYASRYGEPRVATRSMVRTLLKRFLATEPECTQSLSYVEAEWHEVIDAWQLLDWESYRDVRRLGRKTRLGEKQRDVLWRLFVDVRKALDKEAMCTLPGLYAVVSAFDTAENPNPYEYIVADEAQDMSVPQLRLVASINSERPDALFFAGDLGQRIFQTPFSWKSLGVDVRGRSKTLRINYRTTHQIRLQADRLLPDEISDVDGNKESRSGTVSVFNGSPPVVHEAADLEDERRYIADWITQLIVACVKPHEIEIGRAHV